MAALRYSHAHGFQDDFLRYELTVIGLRFTTVLEGRRLTSPRKEAKMRKRWAEGRT